LSYYLVTHSLWHFANQAVKHQRRGFQVFKLIVLIAKLKQKFHFGKVCQSLLEMLR